MIEEVKAYSDERIKNTIQQANNFSEEQVEAAKEVALERGLYSREEIEAFLDAQEIEAGEKRVNRYKLMRLSSKLIWEN